MVGGYGQRGPESIRGRMADAAGQRGRRDWIDAGLRALAEGGVEAVRVEALARVLGVTKGSFYWHFRDRADLLKALLAEWEARRTEGVIQEADAAGGDASARLLNVTQAAAEADARLELGMRSWGAVEPLAAAAVARSDRRRLDYLAALFSELGFSPHEAKKRARLAYLARLGQLLSPADPEAANDEDALTLLHSVLSVPLLAPERNAAK